MWPFKKKLISYIPPFSYFALFNTLVDIAKENGKIYTLSSLDKVVYLTYGLYAGKYKTNIIQENLWIYGASLIFTNSLYNLYMSKSKLSIDKPVTKHIGKYNEIIDSECECYNNIKDIYCIIVSKMTDAILLDLTTYTSLVNTDTKTNKKTYIYNPVRYAIRRIGCDGFYLPEYNINSKRGKELYDIILHARPRISYSSVEKYFSYFFDGNKNYIYNNFNKK